MGMISIEIAGSFIRREKKVFQDYTFDTKRGYNPAKCPKENTQYRACGLIFSSCGVPQKVAPVAFIGYASIGFQFYCFSCQYFLSTCRDGCSNTCITSLSVVLSR